MFRPAGRLLMVLFLLACPAVADEPETAAAAEPSSEVATFLACAEEFNDIARLRCFDAAVDQHEAMASASPPVGDRPDEEIVELDGLSAGEEVAEQGEEAEQELPEFMKKRRPTDPKKIVEADEKMVENCEFLGTVIGKSGWGGLAAGAASRGSMRGAKKRAAKLGATHIVIGDFKNARGGFAPTVSTTQARAYACDK